MPEPPVGVHNLGGEVKEPVVVMRKISPPIIVHTDMANMVTVTEVQVDPKLEASLPPVIKIEPANIPSIIGPFVVPERVAESILLPPIIAVQPQVPVEVKLPVPIIPCLPDKSEALPELPKPVKQEETLGTKLVPGQVVDADKLPPPARPWNPDPKNKHLVWFDTKWRSDGEYELVNYCLFPMHMELELRRL